MKIGFFADSYRPYVSGVVRSMDSFRAELQELGHQVYIFAPQYPHAQPEEGVFRFLSVPAPTNREFSLPIPLSFQMTERISQLGLDLLHVHSPFLLGGLGAVLALRTGLPLVFTHHTLYDQYVHYVPLAQNLSRWAVQKYTTDYCNHCDLVIAPSTVIADTLRKRGVITPIEVIPTGIDLQEFEHLPVEDWLKENYGIPDEQNVLLNVGRMSPEKNIPFLLRAFAQVYKEYPNTTLVLVGSGPSLEEYQTLSRALGIEQTVIFTGGLDRGPLINCYRRADIFVFSSLTETQGIVLAEAKAGATPVVAIDANGVRDSVINDEDGFLTPNDLDYFCAKIRLLLDDPGLRRTMGQKARENAQQMSSKHSARKLEAAYTQLTGSSGSIKTG